MPIPACLLSLNCHPHQKGPWHLAASFGGVIFCRLPSDRLAPETSGFALVFQITKMLVIAAGPGVSKVLGDLPLTDDWVFEHRQLRHRP